MSTNSSQQNKAQNPMSEYLLKLQLIVNNTEFKNKAEANKYETLESKEAGSAYVRAKLKTDIFESYQYDSKEVYKVLASYGYSDSRIFYFLENPQMIPQTIKDILMTEERDKLIVSYVERNPYYTRLMGIPFPGNDEYPADEILTIPDEFYDLYKDDNALERNQPVHQMPTKYQELFMNSEYYTKMITDNPDAKYLQYIGSNSIPIHISRPAKDGDILRINTSKLSTYNEIFGNVTVAPDIIHGFVNVYKETRDYVYNTLAGDFSQIYPNYDSFIRFLTIYLSIGNSMNEFMKKSASLLYMNNVTANNFFMLYGLPSVIMEGTSMIEFLKKFRMILMDKGTNVVYRVKDLIGYDYTDIYTLIMVKQQVFEDGIPIYYYDEDGNKHPKQEIVFRRLGTTDDNTSYFKFRSNDTSYTVDEITSGDPRWWNTPEVEQMLQEMNYTLSNSKYIQLSTHLSMTDIWWQCVILLRGLLDRKQETQFTKLNINFNINGSSELSLFDAVLTLVVLMNWQMVDNKGSHANGNMYNPNGTYKGKEACLDLLFNGLYCGLRYERNIRYYKDQLIGLTADNLYKVTKTFISNNDTSLSYEEAFQYEIDNDNIIPTDIEDGSPKELKLGLPFKIASFNFRIREEDPNFYNSIKEKDYIEPAVFLPMLDKVLDREEANIGEVMMTDVRLIYKYLEEKLRKSLTIGEFRQVTDVFSKLFLVDPVRNWYDSQTYDVDNVLMDEFGITESELSSLKSAFYVNSEEPDLVVTYKDIDYPISLYDVLNYDSTNLEINGIYPFRDDNFIVAFTNAMNKFTSEKIETSSISQNIKDKYQDIIINKVMLDIGNVDGGPKTMESLLFRINPSLYRYIMSLKTNPESLILLMRSIIKALESYTNSKLSGLEFSALGVENYFYILKEVISYFKSYMVEFTKDEFVYIFDGLFDNGGNSNMLRLYDDIPLMDINILPKDSLTMYDVSKADVHVNMKDEENIGFIYDEAIFRIQATYQTLLDSGYEIWYDDGKNISRTPFEIEPEKMIIANILPNDESSADSSSPSAYKIIIPIQNIHRPNYVGNAIPL